MSNEPIDYHTWETASNWLVPETQFDLDYPSTYYNDGSSIAAWIVSDIFSLNLSQESLNLGGNLPGYDINSADALQTVQLSLAQELANGRLVEVYADEEGNVRFYLIGEATSNIFDSDILYKIETSTRRSQCDLVVVDGYDPPPKVYINNEKAFNLFTFYNDYAAQNPDSGNPTDVIYPRYYVLSDIFSTTDAVNQCDYQKEGFIEYGKLNLGDIEVQSRGAIIDRAHWEQLISLIYEINTPYTFDPEATTISFHTTTPRYIVLDDFGILQPRVEVNSSTYQSAFCASLTAEEVDAENYGVLLPESDNDKFLGVKDVFIYGYKLKLLKPYEYKETVDGNIVAEPGVFEADLDTLFCEVFTLTRGQDYQVVKGRDSDYSTIVFSCNVTSEYIANFGGSITAAPAKFHIAPTSIVDENGTGLFVNSNPFTKPYASGFLADQINQVNTDTVYQEVLFPIGNGEAAYAVKKIVVVYDWDNPCVRVSDIRNNVDRVVLESLAINCIPIIRKDPPSPTAVNGSLIDKTIQEDVDPTTFQDLSSNENVVLQQSLEGGDVHLSFPFADSDDCINISNFIKGIIDNDAQMSKSVTYTCDPNAEPVLGELLDGGVINSIDYSYQDSSQYVITVTTGPMWLGIGSTGTTTYNVKTETIQANGVVTSVQSDNITCNVSVNRFGDMQCINLTKDILQIGDKVNVSIYNNPVSYQ